MQDEMYMARALKLAARGRFTTHPNPNVGCVIVKDGEIVGEGFHYRAGEPHAEVHALRMAGDKAKGATAYVTLEPCSHHGRTPPCCDALIAAGVARVVAAMQDPNPQVAGRGLYRLQQAGIDVSHGLMMNEAEALNKGFLKRMRTGFPWIQLKMGASLDGRTAMASGERQWITSPQARRDVQRLRDVPRMSQEEGINLAGIRRILELERRVEALEEERDALRDAVTAAAAKRTRMFAASADGPVLPVAHDPTPHAIVIA